MGNHQKWQKYIKNRMQQIILLKQYVETKNTKVEIQKDKIYK